MAKFKVGDLIKVKGHFAKVISEKDGAITATAYAKDVQTAYEDTVVGLQLNANAISFLEAKKATKKDLEDLEVKGADDETKDGEDDTENNEPKTIVGRLKKALS